ncbi:hypothetical protein KAZ66_04710, partial [Candidatus Woesebacteria bacterium]|nr:hypothetical protein [Candidatus Woesebacteria bacterium]
YYSSSYNNTTMIRPELIEKFKKLYYEKFHIQLTNEQATPMFIDLVNLMEVLLRPNPDHK